MDGFVQGQVRKEYVKTTKSADLQISCFFIVLRKQDKRVLPFWKGG
jgi:hypothetical protein